MLLIDLRMDVVQNRYRHLGQSHGLIMSQLFNPDQLSPEELTFLRHHDIDSVRLFDARSYPVKGWGDEARKLNVQFGIGSPCKAGHRIRARSGHCVVCWPKNINYQKNHTKPGWVYIASSKAGRIHKIGSTTTECDDREARLRRDGYAGFDDWVIVAWFKSAEAQREEMEIQGRLSDHRSAATYNKSTGKIEAKELFGHDLRPILSAFNKFLAGKRGIKTWQHPKITEFDFQSLAS